MNINTIIVVITWRTGAMALAATTYFQPLVWPIWEASDTIREITLETLILRYEKPETIVKQRNFKER